MATHRMSRKRIKLSLAPFLTIVAALVGAALLAACGSSSKTTTSTSSGSSAGVSRANAVVASLSRPATSFQPPGPALKDVKKLRGKTVWYIPISLSVPVFAIGNSALHTALGKAGVGEHACSGEANPSATAACINQAVASGAGAIITDAVPVALAANAFSNAERHHIPVLIVNQLPPPHGVPGAVQGAGNDRLAYALLQDSALVGAEADWVIAHSHGNASVLLMPFTDSPSTLAYAAKAQAIFHRDCPGCKV